MLKQMDEQEVQGCTKCGLADGRTKTVFGEGAPDAQLMFIGEGPGRDEDLQGRPFVGRAGEKLNEMITAMGISREDVFIANVVKCRPPQNRTPTPVEISACFDYLLRQISIIEPKDGPPAGRIGQQTFVALAQAAIRVQFKWIAVWTRSPVALQSTGPSPSRMTSRRLACTSR